MEKSKSAARSPEDAAADKTKRGYGFEGGYMADSQNKAGGLTAAERLKSTEKYLSEMRGVLNAMDEIAAMRAKRGDAPSDDYNGYKRSSVEKFVKELEKQRSSILAEIESGERKRSEQLRDQARREHEKAQQELALARREREQAQVQQQNKAISELSQKVDSMAITPRDSAVASFRKGDVSLAVEGMYSGLSLDIEKMRDDILQELKYSYKQDMAIYDDLSAKIDAIKPVDTAAFEETLKPIGEGITALDEKLNALQPVDYDQLADRVAAKVVSGGIDYETLARHIVEIMAGAGVGAAAGAAAAAPERAEFSAMQQKIDDIKSTLDGAVSVKHMPEFRKLDTLIAQYLRTLSYDLIPDLLVTANRAKDDANRYIISGNILRGETMLSDLRVRLSRVNIWGTAALTAVSDAVAQNHLPVTYSAEALEAFRQAVSAFEQAPALPQEDVLQKLLSAKNALFLDTDMEAMDRDTLAELMEMKEAIGENVPEKGQIDNLNELKKEIMSFNLSYFIDFSPVQAEEKPQPAPSVDTQAILDAIGRLNVQPAAQPSAQPVAAEPVAEAVHEKIAGIPRVSAPKKPRVLRPAVSSKDNKVEHTEQPLRVTKRKLPVKDENPDALSKQIVSELASRIANSRLK